MITRAGATGRMEETLAQLAQAIAGMKEERVPPPAVFGGSGSVDHFFEVFEKYAKSVYGVDKSSWRQVLPTFVTGEPRSLVEAFEPQTDYETVKARVTKELKSKLHLGNAEFAGFFAAVRHPGETLPCYAIRLEGLVKSVAGATEETQRKLVTSKLISSLEPAVVQQLQIQLAGREEVSPTQLVHLATVLESSCGGMPKTCPLVFAAQSTTETRNVKPEPAPAKMGSQAVGGFVDRPREKTSYRCFQCQEEGHYAKNCPQQRPQVAARERGRYPPRMEHAPVLPPCLFCGRVGHVMADCLQFRTRVLSCAFCGSAEHPSYRCRRNPVAGSPSEN